MHQTLPRNPGDRAEDDCPNGSPRLFDAGLRGQQGLILQGCQGTQDCCRVNEQKRGHAAVFVLF